MPSAADGACKIPDSTPEPSGGAYTCRRGCGGVLHGICDALEQEGGNDMRRICPSCASKSAGSKRPCTTSKGLGAGASKRGKSVGRKQGPRTQPRARLSHDQKMTVLELLSGGKTQKTIAERFNTGDRTIRQIKSDRAKLESTAKACNGSSKTNRPGDYPEVRHFLFFFCFALDDSFVLSVPGGEKRTRKKLVRVCHVDIRNGLLFSCFV